MNVKQLLNLYYKYRKEVMGSLISRKYFWSNLEIFGKLVEVYGEDYATFRVNYYLNWAVKNKKEIYSAQFFFTENNQMREERNNQIRREKKIDLLDIKSETIFKSERNQLKEMEVNLNQLG